MSRSLIILFSTIILFSCTQPESKSVIQNSIEPRTKIDSIVELPSYPELSDTRKTLTKNLKNEFVSALKHFARKTYFLTSDYDLENCLDLSRCDCCTSEIAFLDEQRYVYMFVCEASTTFLKGTYEIDSIKLTLKHDSIVVSDEQPMFEEELDTTMYGVFVDHRYIEPLVFRISECNERRLIETMNNSNKDYGMEGEKASSLKLILSDQSSEIVEKLEMK